MSQNKFFKFLHFSLLTLLLFLNSCANIISPTGGAKDERPPKLIDNQSTKNFQTNFTDKSFELTYDEWIQLKDVFNQVLISPPLEFRPEVSLKKRTVLFEFDKEEILREDATYVINFGKAISDLTESNPADMIFVFSTGNYIDSLKIDGEVVDAFSGEAMPDVLVMAYDNLADSVFRTERPFYFGRTDKDGHFEIQNMKSDTFKITAIIDGNLNYKFDTENEKIGYLDRLIIINDSTENHIHIRLFQENLRLFLKKEENEDYGKVKLIFNKLPEEAKVTYDDFGQYVFTEIDKDTLNVWYDIPLEKQYILNEKERDSTRVVFDAPESLKWNIYVQIDTLMDTILVKKNVKTDFATKNKLKIKEETIPNFHPNSLLNIKFNHPIYSIDTNLLVVKQDSIFLTKKPNFFVDSVNQKQINILYNWKENANFSFKFSPNSIIDQFGLSNQDTITFSQKIASLEDFGNLTLKFIDLEKDKSYFIQLLDSGNKKAIEEFSITGKTSIEKQINTIAPGKYKLQIIEDLDKNGKWSTGNYDYLRQPERMMEQDLEEVRANWDVEAEISIKKIKKGKNKSKGKSPVNSQPNTDKKKN